MLRKVLSPVPLVLLLASPVLAQTTTTPVFLSPYRAFPRLEFGASLSDVGHGFAAEGFYRAGSGRYDFGFRGGFLDRDPGDTQFVVGADFRTRVVDHSEDFPLDGAFTAGIGGLFGNGSTFATVPVGISLGRRIELEDSNVKFVPYLHPVLAPTFGEGDADVKFGLGLGVDISLSRRFEVRVSGALGDYDGVGISVAFLR